MAIQRFFPYFVLHVNFISTSGDVSFGGHHNKCLVTNHFKAFGSLGNLPQEGYIEHGGRLKLIHFVLI